MVFNTGYLCLNCGSRKVYASLSKDRTHGLSVTLWCANCKSNETHGVALLGNLFDYRVKEEWDNLSEEEKTRIIEEFKNRKFEMVE